MRGVCGCVWVRVCACVVCVHVYACMWGVCVCVRMRVCVWCLCVACATKHSASCVSRCLLRGCEGSVMV